MWTSKESDMWTVDVSGFERILFPVYVQNQLSDPIPKLHRKGIQNKVHTVNIQKETQDPIRYIYIARSRRNDIADIAELLKIELTSTSLNLTKSLKSELQREIEKNLNTQLPDVHCICIWC